MRERTKRKRASRKARPSRHRMVSNLRGGLVSFHQPDHRGLIRAIPTDRNSICSERFGGFVEDSDNRIDVYQRESSRHNREVFRMIKNFLLTKVAGVVTVAGIIPLLNRTTNEQDKI